MSDLDVRLRLDLGYDGTRFHGWAKQPGLRTVQGVIEDALDTVMRTEGCTLTVAGRTDTGVHARHQVAHLDADSTLVAATVGRGHDAPADALARRLNGLLGGEVRVHRIQEAPAGFDARFSALWRRYAYRLVDQRESVDPLRRHQVVAWPRSLDVETMNDVAAGLLGEHDFAAFCRRRAGATTVRSLLELRVERTEGQLEATVRADAFCHSMVRALMGCLVAVGEGRREPEWAAGVLAGRQRDPAVRVMPARGLTLEEVRYPAAAALAARAAETRVMRAASTS